MYYQKYYRMIVFTISYDNILLLFLTESVDLV